MLLILFSLIALVLFSDVDRDGFSFVNVGSIKVSDCSPFNSSINPNAEEINYDSIDQNCDGSDNYNVNQDNDGDGFTILSGDCNDDNRFINPLQPEVEKDKLDNDCDNIIDEKKIKKILIKQPITTKDSYSLSEYELFINRGVNNIILKKGILYNGRLSLTGTTSISEDEQVKSVVMGIYITDKNKETLYLNHLDAQWKKNGYDHLDMSKAYEKGGIFYLGQTRNLDMKINAIPIASKDILKGQKEYINLVDIINKEKEIYLGFKTNEPSIGIIKEAILELEVSHDAEIEINDFK